MRPLILVCTLICPILAQPGQNTGNPPSQVRPAPVIRVTKDGTVWLNDQRTDASHVVETIQQRFGTVKVVYLRSEKETLWMPIAQVVNSLRSAKPPMNIDLVTTPEPPSPKAASPGRREP